MNEDRLCGVLVAHEICQTCQYFRIEENYPNPLIYGIGYFCEVRRAKKFISIPIGGKHGEKAEHFGKGRGYTNHLPVDCVFVLEQVMQHEARNDKRSESES